LKTKAAPKKNFERKKKTAASVPQFQIKRVWTAGAGWMEWMGRNPNAPNGADVEQLFNFAFAEWIVLILATKCSLPIAP
jgi:hypothetical protein